jgi:hypothetical protein
VEVPDVHYARSGDVAVAYQVVGEGSADLVFLPFLSGLWWLWQYPHFAPFANRLAESNGSSSSTRAEWASLIGHGE